MTDARFDLPEGIPDDKPWAQWSNCLGVDTAVFFGSPGERFDPKPAKAICGQCITRPACLRYAVDNSIDHGVFGGLTYSQRRRFRTSQNRKAS